MSKALCCCVRSHPLCVHIGTDCAGVLDFGDRKAAVPLSQWNEEVYFRACQHVASDDT
jgi:hypothetical protein